VNAAVRDGVIARSPHVVIADISAGTIEKNLQYHWTRIKRVMQAAWTIVRNAKIPQSKIYMVTQVSY
jgi:hypothetical protein